MEFNLLNENQLNISPAEEGLSDLPPQETKRSAVGVEDKTHFPQIKINADTTSIERGAHAILHYP